jgi:hypothetical protein
MAIMGFDAWSMGAPWRTVEMKEQQKKRPEGAFARVRASGGSVRGGW